MFVIETPKTEHSKNYLNLSKTHGSKLQHHLLPFQMTISRGEKKKKKATLLVQWLKHHDPDAGVPGLIPGHGIRFHTVIEVCGNKIEK